MLIKDLAAKNEAITAYYRGEKPLEPYHPYAAGFDQEEKPSVLITTPKKEAVVTRGLRGIDIDGTTLNANNLELTWTGDELGSESLSATWDKWDGILSIKPGQYKLTATVTGGISHSVSFRVILKPAITAYTVEDIKLLNTFQWAGYNKSPEALLVHDLAVKAGLVDKKDDFSDTATGSNVTDKVQAFASKATGDFNLFYSGSGDKAFIDKKVTAIFGTHLSDDTKTALIEKLESKTTAGFIDATKEFHEAMNNTLTIFFADNSIGKMISQLDTSLVVTPTMTLMMDAAKTVVNVKLNIELSLESNGAPLVMREQAKKQLFDMVAIEVVGMAVGGVVLKVGSKAFKVIKSFFGKYKFKFRKKSETFIDPRSVSKLNDPTRKPKIENGRVAKLNKDGSSGKTIAIVRSKERVGKTYTTEIDGKEVSVSFGKDGFVKFDSKYDTVIDDSLLNNGSRKSHFKDANNSLARNLKDDPSLAKKMNLTKEQRDFFDNGVGFEKSPPGLTWHHHQDVGKMELVDRSTHADPTFRHTGGFSIWGK